MITLQIGGELSVSYCLIRIPLHCVSVRLAASVMITKTTFNLVLSAYSSKRSSSFSSLLIVCDRYVKIQLVTKFKNNCGKLIQSHLRIFTISEPMVDHLEQGWCSGESARLPPVWPGFHSRTRRHMWVEFVVGSLLCSERFSSGYSRFPLFLKTNLSKFQFDPGMHGHVWTSSCAVLGAPWSKQITFTFVWC